MDAGYMDHASCIMSQEIFWSVFLYGKLLEFFVVVVEAVYIKMGVNYMVLEQIPCRLL
jgi:hypothetical protein